MKFNIYILSYQCAEKIPPPNHPWRRYEQTAKLHTERRSVYMCKTGHFYFALTMSRQALDFIFSNKYSLVS